MKIGKTLYVVNRKDWRSWLRNNHDQKKEIWLIYYRKHTGRPRIDYNDAVEEALCYGWIDSTVKGINEEKFAQRFTPRKSNSVLSEANKERIRRLIKNKLMTQIGLKSVSHAFDKDIKEKFVISNDILKAIKSNKQAWKNFQRFSLEYKRVRIGYIDDVRGYDKKMFQSRLNNFIKKSAKNIKFGQVR